VNEDPIKQMRIITWGAERMEKQKRPILDTAKGKPQIEAESNQKKPFGDLRVARNTTKMAIRKHMTH